MANLKQPKLAAKLVDQMFGKRTRSNPVGDENVDWKIRLTQLMASFAADGVATTTWNEVQWREILEKQGLTPNQVVDAMDILADWGVTDDA
jgi:hypothetical protein